jgi:hypothetical protein
MRSKKSNRTRTQVICLILLIVAAILCALFDPPRRPRMRNYRIDRSMKMETAIPDDVKPI